MRQKLVQRDKEWINQIQTLERAYPNLKARLRESFPDTVELWDEFKPYEKCVTYARVSIDKLGEMQPVETVLTNKDEQMTEQGLDYAFCL
jgi:hypothetical protein